MRAQGQGDRVGRAGPDGQAAVEVPLGVEDVERVHVAGHELPRRDERLAEDVLGGAALMATRRVPQA